jgi:hypothetical protein
VSAPVDVLGQLENIAQLIDDGNPCFIGTLTDNLVYARDVLALRAVVFDLIQADRAFDFAERVKIAADNAIVRGDRSDDAFVRQANADHAYARAVDARRLALARCGAQP